MPEGVLFLLLCMKQLKLRPMTIEHQKSLMSIALCCALRVGS